MSDTPRTDAAPKAAYRDAMFCELVSADFARTLERENALFRITLKEIAEAKQPGLGAHLAATRLRDFP